MSTKGEIKEEIKNLVVKFDFTNTKSTHDKEKEKHVFFLNFLLSLCWIMDFMICFCFILLFISFSISHSLSNVIFYEQDALFFQIFHPKS